MNTLEIILITMVVICFMALVYLFIWVGPRINRIYNVQMSIHRLVFARYDWYEHLHLLRRDTIENLEYRLRPINMRTFLSQAEIDALTSNSAKA